MISAPSTIVAFVDSASVKLLSLQDLTLDIVKYLSPRDDQHFMLAQMFSIQQTNRLMRSSNLRKTFIKWIYNNVFFTPAHESTFETLCKRLNVVSIEHASVKALRRLIVRGSLRPLHIALRRWCQMVLAGSFEPCKHPAFGSREDPIGKAVEYDVPGLQGCTITCYRAEESSLYEETDEDAGPPMQYLSVPFVEPAAGCIRWYHGTVGSKAHSIISGKPCKYDDFHDFGAGFYVTLNWEVAAAFAIDAWIENIDEDPAVIAFDVDASRIEEFSRWEPSPSEWIELVWTGACNTFSTLPARDIATWEKLQRADIVSGQLNGNNDDIRPKNEVEGVVPYSVDLQPVDEHTQLCLRADRLLDVMTLASSNTLLSAVQMLRWETTDLLPLFRN
jgi:hypothetical protein